MRKSITLRYSVPAIVFFLLVTVPALGSEAGWHYIMEAEDAGFEPPAETIDEVRASGGKCVCLGKGRTRQKAPKNAISRLHLRPLNAPLVHTELMPQRQILCLKSRSRSESRGQESDA